MSVWAEQRDANAKKRAINLEIMLLESLDEWANGRQMRGAVEPCGVELRIARMRRVICLVMFLTLHAATLLAQKDRADADIRSNLKQHEYDLSSDGRAFLLSEASNASFFMLGELHGENEIPTLLKDLWPAMWDSGYRYIAAEVSPWAAHRLEFAPADSAAVQGLWSKSEAQLAHSLSNSSTPVLWGCDMEEMQPQELVRELGALNPRNASMKKMAETVEHGYDRKMAPALLELLHRSGDIRDEDVDDVSLIANLQSTLEIDVARGSPATKLKAQLLRESLMKGQFLIHYRKHIQRASAAKVMLRFGRNHLHRGYDERGISTLGNFVVEFAFSEGKKAFNVAAFGAGGTASLAGDTWNADERSDDLAFQFLASLASYPATVFDLRPLRPMLHAIPASKRSALENRLFYWSNSYDAIICYKHVTPRVTR